MPRHNNPKVIKQYKPQLIIDLETLNSRKLSATAITYYFRLKSKPKGWNFSIRGLEAQYIEGKSCIQRALNELEENGFLMRRQVFDKETGRIVDTEYIIFDEPNPEAIEAYKQKMAKKAKKSDKKPKSKVKSRSTIKNKAETSEESKSSCTQKPVNAISEVKETSQPQKSIADNPVKEEKPKKYKLEKSSEKKVKPKQSKFLNKAIENTVKTHFSPCTENPYTENRDNKNIIYKDKENIISYQSDQDRCENKRSESVADRKSKSEKALKWKECLSTVRANIGCTDDNEEYSEVAKIITDVLCSDKPHVRIGRRELQTDVVKRKLSSVRREDIEYLFDSIALCNSTIHDPQAYILTSLYNNSARNKKLAEICSNAKKREIRTAIVSKKPSYDLDEFEKFARNFDLSKSVKCNI